MVVTCFTSLRNLELSLDIIIGIMEGGTIPIGSG